MAKFTMKDVIASGLQYDVSEPVTLPGVKAKSGRPEEQFQKEVIEYAQGRGYKVAHFRHARVRRGDKDIFVVPVGADGKGMPDLIMIRESDGRMVVAELKCGKNTTTPEQDMWLALFKSAGILTFVWYPEAWSQIKDVLK